MAGLADNRSTEKPGDLNKHNQSEIIEEAVNKFQEVFMKSQFMETAHKLQRDLKESQRRMEEQARELERIKKSEDQQKRRPSRNRMDGKSGERQN